MTQNISSIHRSILPIGEIEGGGGGGDEDDDKKKESLLSSQWSTKEDLPISQIERPISLGQFLKKDENEYHHFSSFPSQKTRSRRFHLAYGIQSTSYPMLVLQL